MERKFKKMYGSLHKISEKSIPKIINGQLDVKLEQFTKEKHDAVFKKK